MAARRTLGWLAAPLLLAASALDARAQEVPSGEGLESEVVAPGPSEAALQDHTGMASHIDLSEAGRGSQHVDELLDRAVAVSTRSLGGLGDFATVSVRGGSANQVLVLLDGVPLSNGAIDEVNVNLVPAELLAGVDVYRSGAPVWMGAAPMGAAVHLHTRADRTDAAEVGASYGAFGSRRAYGLLGGPLDAAGDWTALLGVQYAGTEGDFRYLDDRGTPFNLGDDRERTRVNNHGDGGSLLARLRWAPEPNLRLALVQLGDIDSRGVPGLSQDPTRRTAARQWRSLTELALQAPTLLGRDGDLDVVAFVDVAEQRFDDSEGELGLGPQRTLNRGYTTGLNAVARLFGPGWLQSDLGVEGRVESYGTGRTATQDSLRLSVAPSLQLTGRFVDERLVLLVGARADAVRSETDVDVPDRTDVPWVLQGGARVRLGQSAAGTAALHATGGHFARMPTFLELFGNAGPIRGNPELRPEEAVGGDLGLSWVGDGVPLDATVAVFRYEYTDLIQYFQNSQYVAQPDNVEGALVQGLELALGGELLPWLRLELGYTYLEGEDASGLEGQDGNPLPARPAHTLEATARGRGYGLDVAYHASFEAEHPIDRAGYVLSPARHLHSLEVRYQPAWAAGFGVGLDVLNLLDQREGEVPLLPRPPLGGVQTTRRSVSDFLGFPLPGRSWFVTLSWRRSA